MFIKHANIRHLIAINYQYYNNYLPPWPISHQSSNNPKYKMPTKYYSQAPFKHRLNIVQSADNRYPLRHYCCHRCYHHNEYTRNTTHVSLYYAISFGVFTIVTRLQQYTTVQWGILATVSLQCYCNASAVPLQCLCKVLFAAHYMRILCAPHAHHMRTECAY